MTFTSLSYAPRSVPYRKFAGGVLSGFPNLTQLAVTRPFLKRPVFQLTMIDNRSRELLNFLYSNSWMWLFVLEFFCLKDIDKYTRHSNFSWTILSKWERRNEVNPLWSASLWDKVRQQNHITLKIQETACSPHPRRLELPTICRMI